jgi:hypothetical protein
MIITPVTELPLRKNQGGAASGAAGPASAPGSALAARPAHAGPHTRRNPLINHAHPALTVQAGRIPGRHHRQLATRRVPASAAALVNVWTPAPRGEAAVNTVILQYCNTAIGRGLTAFSPAAAGSRSAGPPPPPCCRRRLARLPFRGRPGPCAPEPGPPVACGSRPATRCSPTPCRHRLAGRRLIRAGPCCLLSIASTTSSTQS